MKTALLKWEAAGVLFIVLMGSALHFALQWSDYWRPLALIAAVNESTYEHLKLAFWPGLIFALLEYPFIKKWTDNFWVAKALGLLTMPVAIVALFYGYTAVLGRDYLAANIAIFVLAVVLGQLVSYRTMTARLGRSSLKRWSVVGLVIMAMAFSVPTYFPPRTFLFEDPVTGGYGIQENHGQQGRSQLYGSL